MSNKNTNPEMQTFSCDNGTVIVIYGENEISVISKHLATDIEFSEVTCRIYRNVNDDESVQTRHAITFLGEKKQNFVTLYVNSGELLRLAQIFNVQVENLGI